MQYRYSKTMINSNTAVSADYGGWVGELDILIHSTGNIMHLIFSTIFCLFKELSDATSYDISKETTTHSVTNSMISVCIKCYASAAGLALHNTGSQPINYLTGQQCKPKSWYTTLAQSSLAILIGQQCKPKSWLTGQKKAQVTYHR